MKDRDLWSWFDVSSCKSIARDLASQIRRHNALTIGNDEVDLRDDGCAIGEVTLGDAALLHSTFRLALLERRDRLLDDIKRRHQAARDAHPIMAERAQRQFGLRARPVTVRWAMRGENNENGRACVSVGLGESVADIEVLGLSIPDARRLIDALQHALDAPVAL